MSAVAHVWQQLEDWLFSVDEDEVVLNLFPGASDVALAKTTKRIRTALAPSHRELLQIHDGTEHQRIVWGEELLAAADVAYSWDLLDDWVRTGAFNGKHATPVGPVKAAWWHRSWIPLTYDGAGNYHMVDLAPEPGGTVGQVIRYLHRAPERTVVAPSLHEWLGDLVTELRAGKWRVHKDDLVRTDETSL